MVLGQNSSKGGFRVQVRGNFHILTSKKKKKTSEGGFKPPTPPPLDPLLHCARANIRLCTNIAGIIQGYIYQYTRPLTRLRAGMSKRCAVHREV